MMRAPLVLLCLAASPLALANTIYKCTDDAGGTLIANTRVAGNCRLVAGSPDPIQAAPRIRPPSAVANPSPAGFPRVAEDAQKARDSDRRRILEQELAAEQKSLELARRDLADQEAARGDDRSSPRGQERLLPYRERVGQHERNIQAINRELAHVR